MSGVESGAIQSIRNNKNLRRGRGLKFKEGLYKRGCLPVSDLSEKQSKLIERAEYQRKQSVKRQLLLLTIAAAIVSSIIIYWMW